MGPETGLDSSLVLSTLGNPTIVLLIPPTVPVKVGEAKLAFESRAVCVGPETGFDSSLVLSTLANPTIVLLIPPTVPVKVGEAKLAFESRAVCVGPETGFDASLVLSTLGNPTIDLSIPPTVPVKVGEAKLALESAIKCTNSVVAICVVFVFGSVAVGAVGTPDNITLDFNVVWPRLSIRTSPDISTYIVLDSKPWPINNCPELPLPNLDVIIALSTILLVDTLKSGIISVPILSITNAVVAICNDLESSAGAGAVGTPVKFKLDANLDDPTLKSANLFIPILLSKRSIVPDTFKFTTFKLFGQITVSKFVPNIIWWSPDGWELYPIAVEYEWLPLLNAKSPIAVLKLPVVFDSNAWLPNALLESPVFDSIESVPILVDIFEGSVKYVLSIDVIEENISFINDIVAIWFGSPSPITIGTFGTPVKTGEFIGALIFKFFTIFPITW